MNTPFSIAPDWPAPDHVRVISTTRRGGYSQGPYAAFNLGLAVGDDPAVVASNRELLRQAFHLPESPRWLTQVHGSGVVDARAWQDGTTADGIYTADSDRVCVVQTADCLPVVLCDVRGQWVGVAHAGWRGLAGGVVDSLVAAAARPGRDLLAWLGPAIGPESFEVGDDVKLAFERDMKDAGEAFRPRDNGRWLADLYALARLRLRRMGVTRVFGGGYCTLRQEDLFFSYRRDTTTGRMATLVWRSGH